MRVQDSVWGVRVMLLETIHFLEYNSNRSFIMPDGGRLCYCFSRIEYKTTKRMKGHKYPTCHIGRQKTWTGGLLY